jgi:4-hydroxy-tetrahydrodipicolinate synthase
MEKDRMAAERMWGCGTALVTPFADDGSVDYGALLALVEWQIAEGIHYLVPCGSTGEAATLTPAEHRKVVETVVEAVKGRVAVVAGAGSNDTRRAIEMSREMKAAGATHLLHVTPMYNKPPQRALIAHFRAIADAVDLPIMLYNVPGRTGINMEAKTTLALAEVPNIIAVKEASGNITQIMHIIADRPDDFAVISGDDSVTLPIMAVGADGIVSVISNATPGPMSRLVEKARARDFDAAREIHYKLWWWMNSAFIESNPIPVKAALAMQGRIRNVLRSPLLPLADAHEAVVRASLRRAGAL